MTLLRICTMLMITSQVVCSCFAVSEDNPINITVEPNIVVKLNGEVTSSASGSASSHSYSQSISQQLLEFYNSMINDLHNSLVNTGDVAKQNKGKIILGVLGIGYGVTVYQIRSLQSYLKEEGWSSWREELSLEKLYAISEDDLISDLVFSIQKRYFAEVNYGDYIESVRCFFEDVKEEKKLLNRYISINKIIGKLPLGVRKLFFLDKELVNSVASRRQRLIYLESKLYNWFSKRQTDKCMNFNWGNVNEDSDSRKSKTGSRGQK